MSFWKKEPIPTYRRTVTRPCACGSESFVDSVKIIGLVHCAKCGLMYSTMQVENPIVRYEREDEKPLDKR